MLPIPKAKSLRELIGVRRLHWSRKVCPTNEIIAWMWTVTHERFG